MKYAAGIDVGGTNTRVALISETYEVIDRKQFSTNGENPEETLKRFGTSSMNLSVRLRELGFHVRDLWI